MIPFKGFLLPVQIAVIILAGCMVMSSAVASPLSGGNDNRTDGIQESFSGSVSLTPDPSYRSITGVTVVTGDHREKSGETVFSSAPVTSRFSTVYTVRGRVLDKAGIPVHEAGVQLTATPGTGGVLAVAPRERTGEDGTFTVTGAVFPGKTVLRVYVMPDGVKTVQVDFPVTIATISSPYGNRVADLGDLSLPFEIQQQETPTITATRSPAKTPTKKVTLTKTPTKTPTRKVTLTKTPAKTPTKKVTLTKTPTKTPTRKVTLTKTPAKTPSPAALLLPDFVIRQVSGPETASPGDTIVLSTLIENTGNADSPPPTIEFGLVGLQEGSPVYLLGMYKLPRGIGKGTSAMATPAYTIPWSIPQGQYYLYCQADPSGLVSEMNEENNKATSATRTITIPGTPAPLPDLRVGPVSGPSVAHHGDTVTVSAQVGNYGHAGTGQAELAYGLINTQDPGRTWLLGTSRTTTGMDAGAVGTATRTFTLPGSIPDGTYYLACWIDLPGLIPEENEQNNVGTSAPATITLSPAPTPNPAPRPDLYAGTVSGPASATPGNQVLVSFRLGNSGNIDAPSADLQYGLVNAQDSAKVVLLGTSTTTGPVVAGTSGFQNRTFVIPGTITPGSYYYTCIIDPSNTIPESDEQNNAGTSQPATVTIGPALPDLYVGAVTGTSQANAGDPVSFNAPFGNAGPGSSSPADLTFGLIDGTDSSRTWQIGTSRTDTGLAAGASGTAARTYTLPQGIPAGSYYLACWIDLPGVIPESNETNNLGLSAPVSCMIGPVATPVPTATPTPPSLPDLTLTLLDNPPETGSPGTMFLIHARAGNAGTSAAPESGYQLSLSSIQNSTNILNLYSGTVPALDAGSFLELNQSVMVPDGAPADQYYLVAAIDPAHGIAESDEQNNQVTSAPSTISIVP